MVQAPPKPIDPTEPQVNIELVDLQELARINPVAWEQLTHIVDNRQNAERIAELEAHLANVTATKHSVMTKGELEPTNGKVAELHAKT